LTLEPIVSQTENGCDEGVKIHESGDLLYGVGLEHHRA
jgi:hypothetical protein